MASLVLKEGSGSLDLASIARQIEAELPSEARPRFLRILERMHLTATYKLKKAELRDEGWDTPRTFLAQLGGGPGSGLSYVELNAERRKAVRSAQWRL